MHTKRAYIHIGLAKTGTTSIQYAMATGRDHLLEQGYLFPTAGAPGGRSGHHCLAWSLQDSSKLQAHCAGFRLDLFRAAVAEFGDFHLIISSEELSAISYNFSRMRSLLSLFPNHEIYVVAYVREQAEFFNSFWAELVSDLNCQMSVIEFVHNCLSERRYDYSDWFNAWKRLLGARLIVRPFDRAFLANGNVVDDFCSVAGIRMCQSGMGGEWKNRSTNARQIAAIVGLVKQLVRMGLDPRDVPVSRRAQLKRIVNRLVCDPELADGEVFWGIKPSLAQKVQLQYYEANRQFFLDHIGREFVFSAVGSSRSFTAIEYEDLDCQLRSRLEAELVREIERLNAAALGAGP